MDSPETDNLLPATPVSDSDDQHFIAKQPPFYIQIGYTIGVWTLKAAISTGLFLVRYFTYSPPNSIIPEIKSYPARPALKNRIFRPGTGDNPDAPLPLYLDVHGGGWSLSAPEEDDRFCSFMAREFKIIVVSLDYRKAPTWKFPTAVEDIAAVVSAVIEDPSLNTDTSKIVMGGFSAGGNLAFAACQTEELKDRVKGLVGFYPPVDVTESLQVKLDKRPKELGISGLTSSASFLGWAYVPTGADLRNPLLSPRRARRENLPDYVYLTAGERDLLYYETKDMAEWLANPEFSRESIAGIAAEDGWKQGGIMWECARGRDHAFAHMMEWLPKREKERVTFVEALYRRIGVWLLEEVYRS